MLQGLGLWSATFSWRRRSAERSTAFRRTACVGRSFLLVLVAIVGPANRSAIAAAPLGPRWESVYRVPNTDDVDQLISHLAKMDEFQPRSAEDWTAFREHGVPAMKKVSQRVLELTKGSKKSDDYQTAKYTLLAIRVFEVTDATPDEQEATLNVIKKLVSAKRVTDEDLDLAVAFCSNLEAARNSTIAQHAYEQLGRILADRKAPASRQLGKRFLGSARRIGLVGREMQISGKTVEGKEFRWSDYHGKVVLVDFWATWCGVCVKEMPRLRELYAKYHGRGFEVVAISGDYDKQKLAAFIKSESLPWTNLRAEGKRPNPTAEYYGIFAYPTTMLIDRDGKVVTLEARGETLEHWLEKLLRDDGAAEPEMVELETADLETAGDSVSGRKAERSSDNPLR